MGLYRGEDPLSATLIVYKRIDYFKGEINTWVFRMLTHIVLPPGSPVQGWSLPGSWGPHPSSRGMTASPSPSLILMEKIAPAKRVITIGDILGSKAPSKRDIVSRRVLFSHAWLIACVKINFRIISTRWKKFWKRLQSRSNDCD